MTQLLPLDSFRRILNYNPWHFWGFANKDVPVTSAINFIIPEYSWQNLNVAGRQEIREALEQAENQLKGYLQYAVAPAFNEVTLPYPSYFDTRLWRLHAIDAHGEWISVMLPEGYVNALGIESLTLVGTEMVGYSDPNSTGLKDTFDITFATTETDPSKFAVYIAAADRLDSAPVSEDYRILPVSIDITAGVATITGKSWLLGVPALYQGYGTPVPLDPTDLNNFVTTLEVYTRVTDPDGQSVSTSQGELIWNTLPYPNWSVSVVTNNATDPASQAYALARVGIRDAKKGIVIPGQAVFNTTTNSWQAMIPAWNNVNRPPDRVTIRYNAGFPLDANGNMNRRLQTLAAVLAMADMPERIAAADVANRTLWRWQQELNRLGNMQDSFAVSRRDMDNPLGNRRGHKFAWDEIQELRLVRGAGTS